MNAGPGCAATRLSEGSHPAAPETAETLLGSQLLWHRRPLASSQPGSCSAEEGLAMARCLWLGSWTVAERLCVVCGRRLTWFFGWKQIRCIFIDFRPKSETNCGNPHRHFWGDVWGPGLRINLTDDRRGWGRGKMSCHIRGWCWHFFPCAFVQGSVLWVEWAPVS